PRGALSRGGTRLAPLVSEGGAPNAVDHRAGPPDPLAPGCGGAAEHRWAHPSAAHPRADRADRAAVQRSTHRTLTATERRPKRAAADFRRRAFVVDSDHACLVSFALAHGVIV